MSGVTTDVVPEKKFVQLTTAQREVMTAEKDIPGKIQLSITNHEFKFVTTIEELQRFVDAVQDELTDEEEA